MQDKDDIQLAVKAFKIGTKVRELRQKNRYTLQDLASRSGLSKPFLSQIENDHAVPPVATLLKLARALNVTLAHFFEDEQTEERISVTRAQHRERLERRPHHQAGEVQYIYEILESRKPDKHMEPFLVEFPYLGTEDMVFMSHEGEEFMYLIEGRLEFRTTDRVEVLEPGDTIYFDSEISHSFRCLGDRPAKAVTVIWNKP